VGRGPFRKFWGAFLCLPLLAAGSYWLGKAVVQPRPRRAPQVRGGDFTLRGVNGPWTLSKNGRDSLVLLYFGFTNCPGLCPMTLNSLKRELGSVPEAQRKRIQIVFVSVDYETDTPATVAAYAKSFGSEVVGLTGTKAELDAITARYGAAYEVKESFPGSGKFEVNHSNQVFVIGPEGTLVDWVTVGYEDAKLGATIRQEINAMRKML